MVNTSNYFICFVLHIIPCVTTSVGHQRHQLATYIPSFCLLIDSPAKDEPYISVQQSWMHTYRPTLLAMTRANYPGAEM